MSGGTLDRITFRPARKDESRTIAMLFSLASDGVADYVWTKCAKPGEAMLDAGRDGTQAKARYSATGIAS